MTEWSTQIRVWPSWEIASVCMCAFMCKVREREREGTWGDRLQHHTDVPSECDMTASVWFAHDSHYCYSRGCSHWLGLQLGQKSLLVCRRYSCLAAIIFSHCPQVLAESIDHTCLQFDFLVWSRVCVIVHVFMHVWVTISMHPCSPFTYSFIELTC